MTTIRTRRTYDYRTREMIWETGNPRLFPELKIPRSTIRSWLHRGIPDVVTCDLLSADKAELLAELQEQTLISVRCSCRGRSAECPEMQQGHEPILASAGARLTFVRTANETP
jgi:hypothetical protein